MQDLQGQKIDR